ncbi:hypothetical protein CWO90_34080 [Bradyrhizobium sp. Leo121]|nr:hypothetical protein CWO90_34080 [Bradyrhizobium sp. Leo121]
MPTVVMPCACGHPVLRGVSIEDEPLWNTGSSAFAGDDSGVTTYAAAPQSAAIHREGARQRPR